MGFYSMPCYFQTMPQVGKPLKARNEDNEQAILAIEKEVYESIAASIQAGKTDEAVNKGGEMTAMQRLEYLIDPGTWCPLNSLYNPQHNSHGSTAVIKGLARISGRWCVCVASDNKKLAGAWIPGQADNLLRASDTAKCLHIPLVYVLNCSGVKLDEQEKVYPNRRGGGTPFYRNSELEQLGVPVVVGIFGTNPAGGGYHSISPTILIAHQKANMAVGGAGIVGGMNPKGYVDEEAAMALIEAGKTLVATPPGSVPIHYGETGFFREVYQDDYGVLEGIKKYMSYIPAYNPEFFHVDDPALPALNPNDLYSLIPMDKRRTYDIYDVIGRLFDKSQFLEYKKGYGPEIVAGLAKVEGLLVGVIGNVQGLLMHYPEYKLDQNPNSVGIGGKLYRQGLIKMNEFVTLCSRDKLPIVWIQDTTGIDVGDDAEKAELLGLGQSLIYSIQNSNIPQLEITLRKGTAAAHYVMGGPQGNDTNAFSLGTAATEIYVMHGETAAAAMYSRRLAKEYKAGESLEGTIQKMNDIIQDYVAKSNPKACGELGLVDEIVNMNMMRNYIVAFAYSVYQNPTQICPFHQMLSPRTMRDFVTYKK